MSAPRVASTRNAGTYLMTARASAVAQDLDGVEVVEVDDGSGDATPELRAAMDDPGGAGGGWHAPREWPRRQRLPRWRPTNTSRGRAVPPGRTQAERCKWLATQCP